ncbi:hypothetical protein NECAME_14714 [Necator americanus]|uniref:Uncharacterized protein n=1 Tax=Necator americanus TaxID=51031 RepID=W2SLG7_NECAM|nr:hypothetical protein NECAME_14714 [Necator americanus]ETN70514.1 hypothetical protein NECAME_14714 [Necator americanus]
MDSLQNWLSGLSGVSAVGVALEWMTLKPSRQQMGGYTPYELSAGGGAGNTPPCSSPPPPHG